MCQNVHIAFHPPTRAIRRAHIHKSYLHTVLRQEHVYAGQFVLMMMYIIIIKTIAFKQGLLGLLIRTPNYSRDQHISRPHFVPCHTSMLVPLAMTLHEWRRIPRYFFNELPNLFKPRNSKQFVHRGGWCILKRMLHMCTLVPRPHWKLLSRHRVH